ncbi:sel1 repeat family protein [Porticoccaceae bacterium]|nr:sel1 repeat family protein [Porticoccaceae bacterium]
MKLILGTVIFLLIMGCNREISESLPQSEIGIRQTVLDIGGGDVEKGLNHLIRLSQDKNATASLLIAQLLESIGDLETSLDYLVLAANQKNPVAMKSLAVLYLKGDSLLKQDYDKSMNWFEKSAEYRNINSMIYLGIMHRDGLGVESDIKTAYFWFTVAGLLKTPEIGNKEPVEFAKELESDILQGEVRDIIWQAEVWIKKHPPREPQSVPPLR